MTPLDTIQLPHGITARIYHDPDVEMPSVCDDALRIVILLFPAVDPDTPKEAEQEEDGQDTDEASPAE